MEGLSYCFISLPVHSPDSGLHGTWRGTDTLGVYEGGVLCGNGLSWAQLDSCTQKKGAVQKCHPLWRRVQLLRKMLWLLWARKMLWLVWATKGVKWHCQYTPMALNFSYGEVHTPLDGAISVLFL